MTPRDHHFFFAKKLIPTHTFQSTEKMFSELTGPRREAFLMFLWNEAGKAAGGAPLPHVAPLPDGSAVAKLEVVGAIKAGGQEVVVLSMPPAIHPNEAAFIALVRKPGQVSVFFYERCRNDKGDGVADGEAVLAEVRPDGSRVNHGFHPGPGLAAFKSTLGKVLGVPLDGLETSLPPITAAAFMAGSHASAGGGGKGIGVGPLLQTLAMVRVVLALATFAIARTVPSLLAPVWQFLPTIYTVLSALIGILLLVWLYQVHAARREQASFSPAMAIVGWLIPVLNFFLPPLIVRSAWRAVGGSGGGLLIFAWWLAYLIETALNILRGAGATFSREVGASGWNLFIANERIPLEGDLGEFVLALYASPWTGVVAYGLLWLIVRNVNARS